MFGLSIGNPKKRLVGSMVLGLLALVGVGLFLAPFFPRNPVPQAVRDFEECVEAAQARSLFQQPALPLNEAQGSSTKECNARFAGRRKLGGGYTYYDFMQDRSFEIAGPNPTAEESSRIDREYIGYLDMQRDENVSAELAKRQDEQLRADLERAHQLVGRPLVLTPKIQSSQASKRPADRARPARCEDIALACGWSKLSTAVKDAFASSSKTRP
jgi:hypothetical protein